MLPRPDRFPVVTLVFLLLLAFAFWSIVLLVAVWLFR
jgi:hypothetical protein